MGNVVSLVTKLLADVTDFQKGMKGATSALDVLKNGMVTASKAAVGLTIGGIGALSAAVVKSVYDTQAWAGSLDDIGDKLGTTTQESAGLAVMVERVGATSEDLTGAFDIMTRGLLDAQGQLGPTGLALQNLGISAMDASGQLRPATEIFQEVADKLGPMPDGLQKTSAMMDIFGRSGSAMGDILGAAADGGLAKFQEEAKNLGLALTPEQVQASIDFGKAMQEWDQATKGLSVTLGTELLPKLTPMLHDFTEWLKSPEVHKGIENFAAWVANDFIPKLKDLVGVVADVVKWFGSLTPGQQTFFGVTAGIIAYGPAVLSTIAQITTAMKAMGIASTLSLGPIGAIILIIAGDILVLMNNIKNAQIIWQWMTTAFQNGANWISTAIQNVIGWFNRLGDSLRNLRLPSWLTPGSPTPLELGIRGVGDAMQSVSAQILPQFSAKLSMQQVAPGGAQAGGGMEIDYGRMGRIVRDAVLQAVG